MHDYYIKCHSQKGQFFIYNVYVLSVVCVAALYIGLSVCTVHSSKGQNWIIDFRKTRRQGEILCIFVGMLSKSKGQILRIATTLHVLFNMETPLTIPDVISEKAIKVAINMVDVCLQHAAFLAERGDIDDTIQKMIKGDITS